MVVVDASALVAALTDAGPDGTWAASRLASQRLVAPHLLPAEAASVLRRLRHTGAISADVATLAHADLSALRVRLLPYAPFADRIWGLGENVSPYDAWYVAVAEALDVPLTTLDLRLARSPGPRCAFDTPEG
jgi:predicted nucleic acid-binding protein